MLDHAYYQIWRPGPDPSYVTDRRFSPYLTEDCDGYAACENRLRALLTAAQKRGGPLFEYSSPTVYEALKRVTFELQEAVRQVLKAHGKQTVRCVPPAHIALLEAPMALSRYSCRIRLDGEELSLSPFRSLGSQNGPALGEWYLENATVFSFPWNRQEAALGQLITATAALRCLLYAQFGPFSETALSPARKKGDGQGYFTYKSLFQVTPPPWPEADWYGFSFTPGKPIPMARWEF